MNCWPIEYFYLAVQLDQNVKLLLGNQVWPYSVLLVFRFCLIFQIFFFKLTSLISASCIYLHTCILEYMHTGILVYWHTYLHAYLHTCIPAFIKSRTLHWIRYHFSESGVPPNSVLFGGTVPPNSVLFGGTVPPNSFPLKFKALNVKILRKFLTWGWVPQG